MLYNFEPQLKQTNTTALHLVDPLLLVACLLSDSLLEVTAGIYLFILYIVIKICLSSLERNFAILIMLVPNLGVMYLFFLDVYIPIVNLLMGVALFKLVLDMKKKSISFTYLLLVLLFIGYEWLHIGGYELSSLPLLMSWTIAVLYVSLFLYFCKEKYNHSLVVQYFLAGLVVSIIIGIFQFYGNYGTLLSNNATIRFNGGAGDANYFSLYIMIGLFSMLLLITKNISPTMQILYSVLFLFLLAFGILSLSRMFFLVASVTFILLLGRVVVSISQYKKQLKFLLSVCSLLGIGLYFFHEKVFSVLTLMISRFTNFINDPSMLTSNRNVLATEYFNYMNSSVDKTVFGIGIQDYHQRSGIYLETHNILLELFVVWGVIGFFVFTFYLLILFRQVSNRPIWTTNFLNWFPLICMAISYLSLNAISNESFFLLLAFALKHIFEI